MFNQHPVFLLISYIAAVMYAFLLNGWKKTLKQNFLITLPGLLIVALLNPLFNHYGVTMLYYVEASGNWITLEALVYGLVLGAVMFIVIQWFSCYNCVMTTDKFVYLFGRIIPALSLVLSMALRFVPRFTTQLRVNFRFHEKQRIWAAWTHSLFNIQIYKKRRVAYRRVCHIDSSICFWMREGGCLCCL